MDFSQFLILNSTPSWGANFDTFLGFQWFLPNTIFTFLGILTILPDQEKKNHLKPLQFVKIWAAEESVLGQDVSLGCKVRWEEIKYGEFPLYTIKFCYFTEPFQVHTFRQGFQFCNITFSPWNEMNWHLTWPALCHDILPWSVSVIKNVHLLAGGVLSPRGVISNFHALGKEAPNLCSHCSSLGPLWTQGTLLCSIFLSDLRIEKPCLGTVPTLSKKKKLADSEFPAFVLAFTVRNKHMSILYKQIYNQ